MPEPFKHLIDPAGVRQLVEGLAQAAPGLDAARCRALATHRLGELELKARCRQIEAAMAACLSNEREASLGVLECFVALLEEGALETLPRWTLWPVSEYLGAIGVADVPRALALMRRITPFFTGEFGIRPLLVHDLETCRLHLESWLDDPSKDVRRLVSEGTRPRLPWGRRLRALVADPRPMLPLLEALRDDPSEYVRRSVANHLNDIAKDHPALFLEVAESWMVNAPEPRQRLLRHASRTLLKTGESRALALHGWSPPRLREVTLRFAESVVEEGGALVFRFGARSPAPATQALRLDYAVH
ncbi:MAG: DNA alkylation repair protein, partial [Opitutales bacterium]